jgi:hypothetical protein
MSRFSDFKLYWEDWGGYPDRDYPFGNPTLMWLIASKDAAARCMVRSDAKGAMDVSWSARWESIPYTLVEPLPALLDEIGAFGAAQPLVQDAPDGDYLSVWDLTGVVGERPFHLSVKFSCPGEIWSPLGHRLRDALMELRINTLNAIKS